jgi:hypothetical protein
MTSTRRLPILGVARVGSCSRREIPMSQVLLCILGVVVYVATPCVVLTYGYLAVDRPERPT